MTRITQPDRVGELLHLVRQRRAVIVTGAAGSGKSHTLHTARETLEATGDSRAMLIVGNAPGSRVPLGAFAGMADLPASALESPAAVVDAFSRRRSHSLLLVDNIELLDEASLYVVIQLICTTQLPTVVTARDVATAPSSIQQLYDAGQVVEMALRPLTDSAARAILRDMLGGEVTPRAEARLLAAAAGNPLHLREIVRASVDDGRLTDTSHGWELHGSPAVTSRLSRLVGERFSRLPETSIEAAIVVAVAGELPSSAIDGADAAALARAGLTDVTECGWLRLSHPLDAEHLLSRCAPSLRHEFAHRAIDALKAIDADERPDAERRANLLALEHGCALDVEATLELAEYALGSFDGQLALRAASAVVAIEPESVHAHRIAGLTASLLGRTALADSHLDDAQRLAHTDQERTAVALARAQHFGIGRHDAAAALRVVQDALMIVGDPECVGHLRRAAGRWAAVAGQATEALAAPTEVDTPEAAASLIIAGMAGVISGPLREVTAIVHRLRQVPSGLLELVPGGVTLVELTEIMAVSYSGDVLATRRRLELAIASARDAPESLGVWEYTLGFLEFLSADAERAFDLAQSAVAHLAWRDSTGLLPAANALVVAAATATGRSLEASAASDRIPDAATADPKVVMLQTWADAWQAHAERRPDQAAGMLLDAAQWLMGAQHTYFAGMLAHCVVRMDRRLDEAAALLRTAADHGGGGLLTLFARHVEAVVCDDIHEMEAVAADARELGLLTTAADTWLRLAACTDRHRMPETRARRHRLAADELLRDAPGLVLWGAPSQHSTLLTEREQRVVELAVNRYTAKEIAEMNSVSVNTVTNQLASAFRKLGVGSRAELRELFGG